MVVCLLECYPKKTPRAYFFAKTVEHRCNANKLHSEIRLIVAVLHSRIDLGFHDFHYNCIITPFFRRKNVSPGVYLGAKFDRNIRNRAKPLSMGKPGTPAVSNHAHFARTLGLFLYISYVNTFLCQVAIHHDFQNLNTTHRRDDANYCLNCHLRSFGPKRIF